MSIILWGSQSNVCPNLIITINVSNIYLCKSTNKKQILKMLCLLKLCIKLRKLFKLKNDMSLICSFFFFFLKLLLFIYFLAVLCLRFCARAFSSCGKRGPLFIAVRGPLTIAASLVADTGSSRAGSVVVALGPSCSAACGIFPDQGSNPCPLYWQADSQPLHHQGSPICSFKGPLNTLFSICRMVVESTTTGNLLQEKADVFNFFSHLISKLIFYVGKITVCEKDPCETVYTVLFIFSIISITLFK